MFAIKCTAIHLTTYAKPSLTTSVTYSATVEKREHAVQQISATSKYAYQHQEEHETIHNGEDWYSLVKYKAEDGEPQSLAAYYYTVVEVEVNEVRSKG